MDKNASCTMHRIPTPVGLEPDDAKGLPSDLLTDEQEAAFALLVQQYGGMVLGVCRRVLRHRQDAEDAAQEVFLLLARKAASIRRRESLWGWLYTSAYRVALRARVKSVRLKDRQRPLDERAVVAAVGDPAELAARREFRGRVEVELRRIPEKFRSAFVLCQMEGASCRQAAAHLGCPRGTVLSRVGRARQRLRARLDPPRS